MEWEPMPARKKPSPEETPPITPLHLVLWNENADLAEACLRHPFVQGLSKGSLDPAAFKRYVAQDVFFLDAFWRAYALAAARITGDRDRARAFHRLMGGVLDELRLHEEYARTLGIDLHRITPYPCVQAYTDFLLRTAWHGGPAETVAAMTPCMRLYAWLGKRLRVDLRKGHPFERWIETYASPEFEALARELEGLLDRLAGDRPAVRDAYRYAMQCEVEFFGAPLAAPRPAREPDSEE
jgi:thiaminase/transcriptional activator TenA